MRQISSPWNDIQVEALNRFQREGRFHPFTCGGDRADAAHKAYADAHGDRDLGLLVASTNGWACPVCAYTQDWAHGFMAVVLPKEEPAVAAVLDKVDADIAERPDLIKPLDAGLMARIDGLVDGVDVDLDAPQSPRDA